MSKYYSFGAYPIPSNQCIINADSKNIKFNDNKYYLPRGLSKSYGDSCLNSDNILIDCSTINKFISFDNNTAVVKAQAGVTLQEIIDVFLPQKYFLPITPGTKYITLGGAIANDVHGKNHHKYGTFGNYVISFDLLRSDGNIYHCSQNENVEMFKATIGGLGLTGLILSAEIQLIKVNGPLIDCENIKFYSFEEFFAINNESLNYDYTVSWVSTNKLGYGIFSRGNFADEQNQIEYVANEKQAINFPFEYSFINNLSTKVFNFLYFNKQIGKQRRSIIDYNTFFYPLDKINNWNRAYGKDGFLQYQFVIPNSNAIDNLKKIFKMIADSGYPSFLTVLKSFGNISSPGLMSFPMEGITLAIDFKMHGVKLFELLKRCDEIVFGAGGRIYPAKDARMKSSDFIKSYPNIQEFTKYIDPKFSSQFWRRVYTID
ncbi:MAG TPA: FAD-binding oxidoreductase [Candidatus Kapabacteria bacterium]|nr:FAD-binding oxidoreductase [Candidatus Kapabacteria bacterium]